MKNIWKAVLLLVGLALVAGGIHHVYFYYSLMAEFKGTYDPTYDGDSQSLFRLTSMRQTGMIHLGLGLLLIHQAVKFHLGYKK